MNKVYIGDNLEIMKGLQDNSVDAIITDPPYLTKNKKLTYSDNMSEEQWIEFMTLRLKECHRILKQTGTLLFNIDERMHIELQTILYEVFGKKNRICTFIWKKRSSAAMQAKFCTVEHEYICAYAKDIKKCIWNGIEQFTNDDRLEAFKKHNLVGTNIKNSNYPLYIEHGKTEADKATPFVITGNTNDPQRNGENKKKTYPLYYSDKDENEISLTPFPGSIEIKPMNGKKPGCWRSIPETCQKLIDADMLVVKNGKIYQKQYAHYQFNRKTGKLEPFTRTKPIRTLILEPSNLQSNKEIKAIFDGESPFTYAKPLDLVKKLIKLTTKEGDTILDIFAGSGTTGQAAFELNRNFTLLQINEGNIPALLKERLNKTIGKDNYKEYECKNL